MREHKVTRTYRLEQKTVEKIDRLATQLQCHQSPLIDMLLQRALEQVEAGNWVARQEPIKYVVKW